MMAYAENCVLFNFLGSYEAERCLGSPREPRSPNSTTLPDALTFSLVQARTEPCGGVECVSLDLYSHIIIQEPTVVTGSADLADGNVP